MASNIPVIVQGNSFSLAIPLQIYYINGDQMDLQDYTPDPTDDVTVQLKGSRRNYTYTPTIDGNVANIDLSGNELADNYSVVVSIVKANGQRLRSFRTDQFFIVESSDDLTTDDIIQGLEENVIYLNSSIFVAGEDGRGITSIVKTATAGLVDTYTITYSDNTTSTFNVTNGAQGEAGATIASVEKTATVGKVDTYTITMTNGSTFNFQVTNGLDGVDLGLANIIDDLTTGGSGSALSAEQGKVLKARTDLYDTIIYNNTSFNVSGGVSATNGTDIVGRHDNYYRTDYIEIPLNVKVLACGRSNDNGTAFVAFYTANKSFISAVKKVGNDGTAIEVNVPTGAKYLRAVTTDYYLSVSYVKFFSPSLQSVVQGILDGNKMVNLIKNAKKFEGYLIDGVFTAFDNKGTTDYIRVSEDVQYFLYTEMGGIEDMNLIAYYSDKDESSYIGGESIPTSVRAKYVGYITLPQGARYVRICGHTSALLENSSIFGCDANQCVEGLVGMLDYDPYITKAKYLLPTYVDVVRGLQNDIFIGDALVNVSNLPYIVKASGGSEFGDGHHYRATPTSSTAITLSVDTYKDKRFLDNDLVGTHQITLRPVARDGGSGTKNILIIGDSLVEIGPTAAQMHKLLLEDNDVTINMIGTQSQTYDGITTLHEGHSGKTWGWFATDSTSPFVFNGTLSFAQYMETHFPNLSGIDYCFILLGTNDAYITVESRSKQLIDALLADYPNCKVAVGLPAYGAPCGGMSNGQNWHGFVTKVRKESELYLSLYDNGEYDANVTCIGQGVWIDRYNDYPHEEVNSTPYSNAKIRRFTNQWHPNEQGYRQWGQALYAKARSWIAGNL